MPHRRISIPLSAILVAICILGIVFTFAPQLGLGRGALFAAILPARNAVMVVTVAIALVAGVVAACSRRIKVMAMLAAVVFVVLGGANFVIVAAHGTRQQHAASSTQRTLRLFEWNTNGALVRPSNIADIAALARPDFIVLPDAGTARTAGTIRSRLAHDGQPFVLFMAHQPGAQVAVLIRAALAGTYTAVSGPDPVKTLKLTSDSGPTILALHAVHPISRDMSAWRRNLDWVTSACAASSRVIVSGDFNSTVDNFGSDHLGRCIDSASAVGSASVGTWPTSLPTTLGMPIDHTLLTIAAGTTVSWTALTEDDRSGARHRPTLTIIRQ